MKRKLLALLLPLALLAGCGANPSAPRVAGAVSLIPEHEAGDKGDFQARPQADAAIGNLGARLLRAVRRPGENTLLSPPVGDPGPVHDGQRGRRGHPGRI